MTVAMGRGPVRVDERTKQRGIFEASMQSFWPVLWLLLIPVLAGCLGQSEEIDDSSYLEFQQELEGKEPDFPTPVENETLQVPAEGDSHQVMRIETPAGCRDFCEPMVAVGHDGRLFVKGDVYQRTTTNGPWEQFYPPQVPSVTGFRTFHSDRAIAIGLDGQLWFHSLVGGSAMVTGSFQYLGVHVAHSQDGGDTWLDSTYISLGIDYPAGALGADRQWIGFGDGSVHLTYQRNAMVYGTPADIGNIWISHATDGSDWSDFSPIQDLGGGSDHATGQMVVREEGIHVPFNRAPQNGGFVVASSANGDDWTSTLTGTSANFFPALVDANGTLVAVAQDGQGGLFSLSSPDGITWSKPTTWNATGTISSPWLGHHDETTWVAWMERTPGTEDQFNVLMGRDANERIEVAHGLLGRPWSRANTDFVHFDFLGGRPLVVAGDNDSGLLNLYWLT